MKSLKKLVNTLNCYIHIRKEIIMKTRTNQPIQLMTTQDIEHLSDSFLNELKCGDIITKQTGEMKHTYVVTYKQEKHGICLSYFACGYLETISYDYTDGHWVFNSKDVCEVPTESGTKLYKHNLVQEDMYYISFYSTHSQPINVSQFNSYKSLYDYLVSINYFNMISADTFKPVFFSDESSCFYSVSLINSALVGGAYDDWDLTLTSDEVIPL